MTEAEYESEVERLRDGRRLFEGVVVSGLRRRCEELEARLADEVFRADTAEEKLRLERLQWNPERDRLVEEKAASARRAEIANVERNAAEKEITVVKRDRDALVRRAETAERTLLNNGFDLRTMQRGAARPAPNPHDVERELRSRELDQPEGRYRTADGRPLGRGQVSGGGSLETGYKNP